MIGCRAWVEGSGLIRFVVQGAIIRFTVWGIGLPEQSILLTKKTLQGPVLLKLEHCCSMA